MEIKQKILDIIQNKVVQLAAIITALLTVIAFTTSFRTDYLKKKLDDSNDALVACQKNKQTLIDKNFVNLGNNEQISVRNIFEELVFLRLYQQYSTAVGLYYQNKTPMRKEAMKLATENLANFIVERKKNIVSGYTDKTFVKFEFSSDELRVGEKKYLIPMPVMLIVNNPKYYEDFKLSGDKK